MLNWCKRLSFAFVMAGSAVSGADLEPTPAGKESGLIDRKIFFGNPDKAAVKLSPDGKQISYIAAVDGVMNVFVGPADKPEAAKPITKDTKRGIRQYFWAFTNQHVLYMQDEGGNEDFHLYRVNLADGEAKDLTPEKGIRAMPEDANPSFPTELLVGINNRDPRFHDLYNVNLINGERKLVAKNEQFSGFQTDNNNKVRFAQKLMPDGSMAIMQPDGNGGWKDFQSIPMEDTLTTHPVGFDKTGDVLFVVDSRNRDTGALTSLDLKTGKQSVMAQDGKCDAGAVMMHPTEHTVQAVGFNHERNRWTFLDPAVKADFEELRKLADGDISVTSRTLDSLK